MANKSITERRRYWLEHVEAAQASGESLVDYARTHKLKVKVLYQWKSKLNQLGLLAPSLRFSEFVPVKPVPPTEAVFADKSFDCALVFPGGLRFEFSGEVPAGVIHEVIQSVIPTTGM